MEGQTLIAITPNELDRITTRISQQVHDGFQMLKSHMVEKPLTKKEAAKYLSIGHSALDNRIKNGSIPAKYVHRNGGTVYFYASELNELIKKS